MGIRDDEEESGGVGGCNRGGKIGGLGCKVREDTYEVTVRQERGRGALELGWRG